jgi:general secretion pathway protein C
LDRDRFADWRGWLPTAAGVVLWLLLAVQAMRWVALFLSPAQRSPHTVSTQATTNGDTRLPAVDLFYRQDPADGRKAGAAALGYLLFGLRTGPDGASAILGKDGKQASYAVGEELAPGVVLAAVEADQAWLAANGQRHRLALPAFDAGRARAGSAGALPVGTTPGRTGAAASPAAPATNATEPGPRPPADGTPAPASATGISAGQLLDASGLAGAAGGLATKLPGAPSALLRMAGLRENDVVLSVEGRPLDRARLDALGGELAGRKQVTLQYRRDGRIHTTTLDMPR